MDFDEIIYRYEEQFVELNNENIFDFVFSFLEEHHLCTKEKFLQNHSLENLNPYTLFDSLRNYLAEYHKELLNSFYDAYRKKNGNLKYLITEDMHMLGKTTIGKLNRSILEQLSNRPYIGKISYEDKKIHITLVSGEEYSFFSIYDYFDKNPKMLQYIMKYRNKLFGQCHADAWDATILLNDSTLLTELIPYCFVGTYYHSIVENKDGMYIDLANEIVYDENVRYNLYQAEVICETKKEDLYQKLEEAKEYFGESPYADALLIAVHQQALEMKKSR